MTRWLVALVLLVPGVVLAAPAPADLQKKARARMKSLDFEAALPLLEQLRDLPTLDAPTRAQALVDLGITFVNLGRADDARKAFDDALEAHPEVPFPSGVPPKIRRLFDEAREARAARLRPAPPPPEKVVEVKPEPKAAPVAVVTEPKPSPPMPKERMKLVPGILVGAGVLGLGAGVSAAFASQNADRKLRGSLHGSADAARLLSNRETYALASYGSYAAGAALIAAGAALFLFTGGGEVSAALTPSSATVTVGGAF